MIRTACGWTGEALWLRVPGRFPALRAEFRGSLIFEVVFAGWVEAVHEFLVQKVYRMRFRFSWINI